MLCVEFFTCAKDPSDPDGNEDQAVMVPGTALAVLDGATDISGRRYDDALGQRATGGRLASRAAMRALQEMAASPFSEPPDVARVVAIANAGVRAVYERLGLGMDEVASGRHRFRTTLAGAFFAPGQVRLVCIGDCAIRVNGNEILRHDFPADRVFSAARAAGWAILAGRGISAEAIRPVVREMIVQGLGPDSPAPAPLTAQDGARIAADVVADPQVLSAFGGDAGRVAQVLASGLSGVRRDPGAFAAEVIDGLADATPHALVRDLPLESVETLEIFSDGYPAIPEAATLAAWEAALRHADEVDPDRIGPFASTKGCAPGRFGDDRTILIARRAPPPGA